MIERNVAKETKQVWDDNERWEGKNDNLSHRWQKCDMCMLGVRCTMEQKDRGGWRTSTVEETRNWDRGGGHEGFIRASGLTRGWGAYATDKIKGAKKIQFGGERSKLKASELKSSSS